jgi:hypothetical protein
MTYRFSLFASLLALLALTIAGCPGGTTGGSDAGMTTDTGNSDSGGSDAGASDAGLDAASTPDAGAGDAGLDAASADGGSLDASTADALNLHDAAAPTTDAGVAACGYVAVDEVVVRCGTDIVFVSHFTSDVAGCAPFYAFDPAGAHFADTASAIASDATCDATCEWHFATSVSRIYCGHRDGYEVLSATGAGCADLYRFAEGYFPSVEAHDAAYPCP